MILDRNNRMVGRAPHIRDIGPHPHEWIPRGSDGYGIYRECGVCGTRAYTGPDVSMAGRKDWLAGLADWDSPVDVTIASAVEVDAALREQREAMRESTPEHRAAMPIAPVPNDPLRTEGQKVAEERQVKEQAERQEKAADDAKAAAERAKADREAQAKAAEREQHERSARARAEERRR